MYTFVWLNLIKQNTRENDLIFADFLWFIFSTISLDKTSGCPYSKLDPSGNTDRIQFENHFLINHNAGYIRFLSR